ncbi:MAG: hypothetical protein KF866_11300 [Phycisphaeraceae bacterium]|nr:hypothetical protein [Phycisphaeraceae bacterium]MCW5754239.1 hypothetical protein [Phycisphaeraceae bacterium]
MSRNLQNLFASTLVAFAASIATADLVGVPHRFDDGYWLTETVGNQVNRNYGAISAPVENLNGLRQIGSLTSQYQLYRGNHTGANNPPVTGTGGFFADFNVSLPANVGIKNNFAFAWVQIVSAANNAGVNAFGAGAGQWFVDIGNAFNANPAYTNNVRNFNDYPDRPLNQNETWSAELALALVNTAGKEIAFIGALSWGFGINNGDVVAGPGAPAAFNGVSDNFRTTFLRDWPSRPDYSDWTIVATGLHRVVPGPTATALMLMGIVAYPRRRR